MIFIISQCLICLPVLYMYVPSYLKMSLGRVLRTPALQGSSVHCEVVALSLSLGMQGSGGENLPEGNCLISHLPVLPPELSH